MEKTVQVVDSVGNRYEATYIKRAKGLVKHGRAHYIDENTICLAYPPNKNEISEDMNMTNNLEHTNPILEEKPESRTKYTLEYALAQIEKIANDKDAILGAFNALSCMESGACPTGGSADAMAKAVSDTVLARETTNQKLLEFYSKMVDDLKPKSEKDVGVERREFMEWSAQCIANAKPGTQFPDLAALWTAIKNK